MCVSDIVIGTCHTNTQTQTKVAAENMTTDFQHQSLGFGNNQYFPDILKPKLPGSFEQAVPCTETGIMSNIPA